MNLFSSCHSSRVCFAAALGYSARLAYGCNIGTYFNGIASSSLHGGLWLVAVFIGSIFGTYLRPLFGLSVEGNLTGAQRGPVARD
jgi:hypothetical protein